jgi:hypothetical protein
MKRHLAIVLAGAFTLAAAGSAIAAAPRTPDLQARAAMQRYRVPDAAGYAAQKQLLAAQYARSHSAVRTGGRTSPLAPVAGPNWEGLNDGNFTPSDSTGAIGTTRYAEAVNAKFGIYDRTGAIQWSTNLVTLTGSGAGDNVFDPQVIWDPQQERFFYAADQVVSSTDNELAWGFSKGPTPTGPGDFCTYHFPYGTPFPDYPKLGDSKPFILIGVNTFSNNSQFGTYVSSDVVWISKPAAGVITSCPADTAFKKGVKAALKTDTGSNIATPVPAQQTDTAGKGWIVATTYPGAGSGNGIYLFSVKKDPGTGNAIIPTNGTKVVVPAYRIPPSAVQADATQTLDTSDTRLTQAVSAIDPRLGGVHIWTQHAIKAGTAALSKVRWYEIDPVAAAVSQTGNVAFAGGFAFAGAISPDRQVNGATKLFGSNMVLDYVTSSSTQHATIRARSKLGAGAISAPITLATSPGPDIDFACLGANDVCRWGDYAAATPDPVVPAGSNQGRVWGSNMFNADARPPATPATQSYWRTRNFAIVP